MATLTSGTFSGKLEAVEAADRLSADLARSHAAVAVSRQRLRALSDEGRPLQASFTATRQEQAAAQDDATAQNARLVELVRQVQQAHIALNQSAIDSYLGGGGPLGEMAVALESLNGASPDDDTGPLTDVNHDLDLSAPLQQGEVSAVRTGRHLLEGRLGQRQGDGRG